MSFLCAMCKTNLSGDPAIKNVTGSFCDLCWEEIKRRRSAAKRCHHRTGKYAKATSKRTSPQEEVAALRRLLLECAEDLEAHIKYRYGPDVDPAQKSKYDAEMETVTRARKAAKGEA